MLGENVLFERTAIDTDADRNSAAFASVADLTDVVVVPDITGIDADLIKTKLRTTQSDLIIEMNIGYDRYTDPRFLSGYKTFPLAA